jgi:hypothetical protein
LRGPEATLPAHAAAALQAVLADPRYSRFLLSLGNWVERRGWRNEIDSEALAVLSQPMPTLADKILARLHRKVRKFVVCNHLRVDVLTVAASRLHFGMAAPDVTRIMGE